MTDNNREIGELKEQGRWLASTVDRIEKKVDQLLVSHTAFKWKIIGGSGMFAFIVSIFFEVWRNK